MLVAASLDAAIGNGRSPVNRSLEDGEEEAIAIGRHAIRRQMVMVAVPN
jgi:hypothetical protein